MITAKIIEDSYIPDSQSTKKYPHRLTTFALSYPRWIHSELMTHRRFSRNASSSRAIPVKTALQRLKDDPAMPVHWGVNIPGMQSNEELPDVYKEAARLEWLSARDSIIKHVESLVKLGLHKQISNRLLEPWTHIEVVVTSSYWANWYALRNHKDAQPEIQELARKMLEVHKASAPKALSSGQWHLPFVRQDERDTLPPDVACKISAARAARVSYLTHDKRTPSIEEDLKLYDRLMGGEVVHASPLEHVARPASAEDYVNNVNSLCGNLDSRWVQFRKTIKNEYIDTYGEFD